MSMRLMVGAPAARVDPRIQGHCQAPPPAFEGGGAATHPSLWRQPHRRGLLGARNVAVMTSSASLAFARAARRIDGLAAENLPA
ncbi:MAG TPA: hypothetical protein VFZ00_24270, partial [Solirubrobacter sp.]|nr:hypothetical protein [Solirubrobacter sp.]